MGIVVDLIIILILGLCIFSGYKRGLAKCLLKLCTSILAIIIAIVLYKPFVNFIVENTTIDDNIQMSFEKIINQNTENEEINVVSEDSGIPAPIAEFLNKNVGNTINENKQTAVTNVSRSAAILIVNVVGIIIIFIIAKILLKIFAVFIDIASKLPIIKQCNELGGLIYGFIEGVIIIFLILTIISVITPLIGNYTISELVLSSTLGKMMYNNNIFLNLIFYIGLQ